MTTTIFRGGDIVTVDPAMRVVQALAMCDGRNPSSSPKPKSPKCPAASAKASTQPTQNSTSPAQWRQSNARPRVQARRLAWVEWRMDQKPSASQSGRTPTGIPPPLQQRPARPGKNLRKNDPAFATGRARMSIWSRPRAKCACMTPATS